MTTSTALRHGHEPLEAHEPLEFVLPALLEAREPAEARGLPRDGVRLLVSYREKDGLVHARFTDLPSFLAPGDVLVVNDSATLPAALPATSRGGQAVQLHLSTHLPADLWVVEPRGWEAGPDTDQVPVELGLPGGGSARLLTRYKESRRLWIAEIQWCLDGAGGHPQRGRVREAHLAVGTDVPGPVLDFLARWGAPIRYPYVDRAWPLSAYQTVFASVPGSAEMPSAGRAFSPRVLEALAQRGVTVARLTLHTGVASAERDEPPYEEAFDVPWATATAVNQARTSGRRVIATGTTVVRALESATDGAGHVVAARGWTDLVVTPERRLSVVDGLLTGFHEPRASHLMMLEAIAGQAHLRGAYRAALDRGYLWHEFGDLHLIL